MTIKVLIVDDSRFIRNRVREILEHESDFDVVGFASNGEEAWLLASQLKPDVITMDVEMPVMNGISSVKKIMAECPTAILMFSAATHAGAQATLDALNAGAVDFLPKKLDEIDGNRETAKRLLRHRVRVVALQAKRIRQQSKTDAYKIEGDTSLPVSKVSNQIRKSQSFCTAGNKKVELLVVVASTGGPVAIQKVLTQLSSNCSFPILIVQHMPQNFTKSFSERLNQLCKIEVKEAENGDVLKPGVALLGPGGMQMEVNVGVAKKRVALREKQGGEIYSPCADITLSSIAKTYSSNVLTVVLTGMGADGKEGAVKLKQKGLSIWAQNEASCTIYGMPKAIVDANLADQVYSLDEIANKFNKLS
jgi:two-component system chemotaxis response regulator CheB